MRPWQTPVPPLTESVTHEVQYPTDEEEFGMLLVSWRGPEANVSEHACAAIFFSLKSCIFL